MPDEVTPKLGLVKPEVGGSRNNWGYKVNANFDVIDDLSTGPYVGDNPPEDPPDNQLWWKSNTGYLYIYYNDGDSKQWVQVTAVSSGGGGGGTGSLSLDTASGITMDTGELYRITMLANGTVTAVPYNVVPPDVPDGLAVTVLLSSISLSWSAAARATSYIIKRNGTQIATVTSPFYRDPAITVGSTYNYTVTSVDQYKQRSSASAPVNAFVDIALNHAPQDFTITVWPNPVPTDGYSFVNVNVRDIDVQDIAYALNVDAGSLTPTADIGVWKLRI